MKLSKIWFSVFFSLYCYVTVCGSNLSIVHAAPSQGRPTATPTDTPVESPTKTPHPAPSSRPTEPPIPTVTETPRETGPAEPSAKPTGTPHAIPSHRATATDTATPAPTESNTPSPEPACDDGVDNDEDGAIDLADPGCSSSDDDDEAEAASTLAISTECVVSNTDGSKTVYFTYENLTDQELFLETNETNGTVNTFVGSDSMVSPPDRFKTGLNRGAVAVTFQGDSLSWIVQSSDGAKQEALASAETAECEPITPFVSCRTLSENGFVASVGYSHENQFDLSLPVGELNQFEGENIDLGQPTVFYPGVQSDVFSVPVPNDGSSLIWGLNGATLEIGSSIPLCAGVCEDYSTEEIARAIRSIAKGLISTTDTAVHLRSAADGSKKPSVALRYKQAKVRKYRALLFRRLSDVPESALTCPGMRNQCQVVDLVSTIDHIKRLQNRMRNVAVMVLNTMRHSDSRTQAKSAKLLQKVRSLGSQGIAAANAIPKSTRDCS